MGTRTETPNEIKDDNPGPMASTLNDLLCDCFPSHCEKENEHGLCWCKPEIIDMSHSKIFVHQDEN